MKRFLYYASALCGSAIIAFSLVVIGATTGGSQKPADQWKPWFDLFSLVGSWVSGIGALAAAYVALNIADKQRTENVKDSRRQTLHYMMALVNDMRGSLFYLNRIYLEGARPLAALIHAKDLFIRRYEALYDREAYTHLPAPIVDSITGLSSSIVGMEALVVITSSKVQSKMDHMLDPLQRPGQSENPFNNLAHDLENLFTLLEDEAKKPDAR